MEQTGCVLLFWFFFFGAGVTGRLSEAKKNAEPSTIPDVQRKRFAISRSFGMSQTVQLQAQYYDGDDLNPQLLQPGGFFLALNVSQIFL